METLHSSVDESAFIITNGMDTIPPLQKLVVMHTFAASRSRSDRRWYLSYSWHAHGIQTSITFLGNRAAPTYALTF